jgi:hypothetical glycosyl hydrolase
MNHLSYDKGTGEEANWLICENLFDERFLGKCEAIYCQGNGYLGVRHALEEEYTSETRNMFVTGTFNKFHDNEVTELPNFPDVTKMVFVINGRPFTLLRGTILHYNRVMNLKNGEVVREVDWRDPEGNEIRFRFARIVSMADEHVIAARVEATPLNGDVQIKLVSGIDGTVSNSGAQHFCEGDKRLYDYKYLEMVSKTVQSGVTAGIYTTHRFLMDGQETMPKLLPIMVRREIKISALIPVQKGQTLTIEKLSAVYTSRDKVYSDRTDEESVIADVKKSGLEKVAQLRRSGYLEVLAESEASWAEIWSREDVKIDSGNPFDQLAVRFSIYHLNIMVKRDDNRVGIGAKALTGEGYKGHSFWDTEVFILPYYLLTEPGTAKTLLEYRYRNLYGARKKAKEYGYEGAMYPWEAAWITDGEVTPIWGPADVVTGQPIQYLTGMIEQHISADIAFAVGQYYMATGDVDFMNRCGYEMILDTARFWVSRIEWKEDRLRYEITDVIGPDEYKEHVDNNAYTNYLAYYNMQLAQKLIGTLRTDNREVYERLDGILHLEELEANLQEKMPKMYLPQPEGEDGIIPQFEGYFDLKYLDLTKYKESTEVLTIYNDFSPEQINSYQVSKQGDLVVLFYLLEDLFDENIKRNNYLYYEERTLHDSSLSQCTHGVVANDLGLSEEAYKFYTGASQVDLGQEMRSSDAGIHSAAMGGIWQVAVLGFGGIRIAGNQLRIHPSLPAAWNSLSFRVVWHNSPLQITVTADEVVIINEGKTVEVELLGKKTTIEGGTVVKARR